MGDGGLPEERHREIAETLNDIFSAQGSPLHKVKGRARASAEASSPSLREDAEAISEARSECEPAIAGEHDEIEVKVKRKVKVKVNLDAKERLYESEKELHKVILAKYGAVKPQYLKDGITILNLEGYLCNGRELDLPYPNDVFAAEIFIFGSSQKGRWARGPYMLELKKGELQEISKATEDIDGELPVTLALWRYGLPRFPKYCAAVIESEEEAERLADMLERDIIEEVPRFKERKQKRDYWRKHRSKAGNGPSTPPHPGSEG